MAGGRKAWQPTEKDLQFIKEMSAKGATQKAIYNGLGISSAKWYAYKKETENRESGVSIKKAIDEGAEERKVATMQDVEDALRKLVTGYDVVETKTVTKTYQGQTSTEEATTVKHVGPNATIAMFLGVNLSEGKYQSINKVEVKQENTQSNNGFKMKWTQKKSD